MVSHQAIGMNIWSRLGLLVILLGAPILVDAETPAPSLRDQAIEESLVPIHPGVPGKQFFWNQYARQFIYAPAFDILADPWPVIRCYRLTVRSGANGKDYVFEAKVPWAPLSPIWKDLPVGTATLTVESLEPPETKPSLKTGALDLPEPTSVKPLKDGAKPHLKVGTRDFFKAAPFGGPYGREVTPYLESARRALAFQLGQKHYQAWKSGKPGNYNYNIYPAKIYGALINGMTRYAALDPKPRDAGDALVVAEAAAQGLLRVCYPAGSKYEFLPPTYDSESPAAKNAPWWKERVEGRINVTDCVLSANAILNLYDVTHKEEYFKAVLRMADTFKKLQLPCGTWTYRAYVETGAPDGENLTIPARFIRFYDRLIDQYGRKEYQPVLDAALKWIWDNPMQTFRWNAEFEDIPLSASYLNLTPWTPGEFADYLLDHAGQHPEYIPKAEELARFMEDQFIIWDRPSVIPNVIVPCGLEQYWCYRPIDDSALTIAHTFLHLYQATHKRLYLEKAISIANVQTATQDPKTGQYRTFWYSDGDSNTNNWDDSATNSALNMLELGELLKKEASR